MRSVIAVFVDNKYGVLARVTSLFMRKGFNIDTLTVGETDNPAYSRITITLNGDEYARDQLMNQLNKLQNVRKVKYLGDGSSVEREIMLVKVKNTAENRAEIEAAEKIYKTKIVDYTTDSLCIEVTGDPHKITAFIELMKPLGIIELCRTGVVALERGSSMLEQDS